MVIRPKPYHLKVFFSNKYVYAQVVRMTDGHIVTSASTIEPELREKIKVEKLPRADKDASANIGRLIADRAKNLEINAVHFQRKRGQRYHGKLASLLDALRDNGLALN